MKTTINKVCFVTAAIALSCLLGSCGKSHKLISVYTQSGEAIAEFEQEYDFRDAKMTYCDVAIAESVQILSEKLECSEGDARKSIWKDEYKIYTYYDSDVQEALENAFRKYKGVFDCGGAVTDLNGNLIASFGHAEHDMNQNYAKHVASPYSSIKPLSVYSQAVEAGLIHWSTAYADTPYKQLEGSDGTRRDWPVNATGEYSGTDVPIFEAIQNSLNTTAVKCLKDVGVNHSIDFLMNNFAMPLSSEQYTATIYGEEEIIGNIAMGYLKEGVTPIDMAGYYQIFGNGGSYEKPAAVAKICDREGKVIYEREYHSKEVISPKTSDLMNKLLQGVVTSGGTGWEAYCDGIEIAGKTGSGDNNSDCWFVGVSPEYSCAIWHAENYKNLAPHIFSQTMEGIFESKEGLKDKFAMHSNLEKMIYCEESGMSISPNCTKIQMGYYSLDTQLPVCDKH